MIENPEKPKPSQLDNVVVRDADGNLITLKEMKQKEKGELILNASKLKPGDKVVLRHMVEDRVATCVFRVKKAQWDDLGIWDGWAPSLTLEGFLEGDLLAESVSGQTAVFIGSGYGGNMVQNGVFVTGGTPMFVLPETRSQISLPYTISQQVLRPNQAGQYDFLDQQAFEAEGVVEKHQDRLDLFQDLMEVFGFSAFDITDGSKPAASRWGGDYTDELAGNGQVPTPFENERYQAEYDANMAMGNTLTVYDKKTETWMQFKYYGFKQDDVLQIGFCRLSREKLEEIFFSGSIRFMSAIHSANVAITTYTTSNRFNLDTVNYKVDDKQAQQVLEVPSFDSGRSVFIPTPNIQLLPDGTVRVAEWYPLDVMASEYPGLLERIAGKASFVQEGNEIILHLGGEVVKLYQPEIAARQVLENMSPKLSPGQRLRSVIRRVMQMPGR